LEEKGPAFARVELAGAMETLIAVKFGAESVP
jgi:hypothetical protein